MADGVPTTNLAVEEITTAPAAVTSTPAPGADGPSPPSAPAPPPVAAYCWTLRGINKLLSDGTHASGGVDAATSEDYAHARRLLQTLPTLAASALRDEARQRDQGTKEAEERIAKKLAHLRRNLSVTCAQRLWPLRWLVTKEQMLAGLWKDLQRTWEAYPAATRGSASAEDCVLLDASRPLRSLLRDLNIPEAVATLFESSMQRLAQAALASAKKKVSSTG